MQNINKKIRWIAGSNLFFGFTIIVFLISSAWIALSARYPMAFDEGYHLGIIQLYAQKISPFFMTQPPGSALFGALTRDPSYLYHYLMSFPYRFVSHFSSSIMAHVMTLRFIDIALFAIAIVLFRAVLLHTRATRATVHVTLFFFVLIPVVPQLAGQVNYDDLLIPLTAWALLLTVQIVEQLKAERTLNSTRLITLLAVCCLNSLVTFPFLPIFAAIVVYVAYEIWRWNGKHPHKLVKAFKSDWKPLGKSKKYGLLVVGVISVGLFVNTYGVNIIEYQNPIPQCGQVLGVARCQTYAPWARNNADALYNKGVNQNPLRFTASWFYGMFYRLFFTINGPGNPDSYANFLPPVLTVTAAIVAGFGFLLFLFYGWSILKRDPVLSFLLSITLAYCAALWGRNYHDFLHLGQMVAINGRYLIPVLPPVMLALIMSYQRFLCERAIVEAILFLVVTLLFLQGAGTISYIYYSKPGWYWPDDSFAQRLNHDAQTIVKPLFISNH